MCYLTDQFPLTSSTHEYCKEYRRHVLRIYMLTLSHRLHFEKSNRELKLTVVCVNTEMKTLSGFNTELKYRKCATAITFNRTFKTFTSQCFTNSAESHQFKVGFNSPRTFQLRYVFLTSIRQLVTIRNPPIAEN